jgi:hypothetical protein
MTPSSSSPTPPLWYAGLGLALLSMALSLYELATGQPSTLLFVALVLAGGTILLWVWRLLTPLPAPVLAQQGPPAPVNTGPAPIYTTTFAPASAPVAPPPDPRWLEKDASFIGEEERAGYIVSPEGLRGFIVPKHDAESLVESEDSFALNLAEKRYAIADGVSGSELPRPWARTLARAFVRHPDYFFDPKTFQKMIPQLGDQWRQWVSTTWFKMLNGRLPTDADVDFQRRLKTGAQATLLGCSLRASQNRPGEYTADVVAVGDADFFVFRRDAQQLWQRLAAFPLENPADFGRFPHTLLTNPDYTARAVEWLTTRQIAVKPGDLLVLGTDSIAKWLLDQQREEAVLWRDMLECTDPERFRALVNDARAGADGHTPLEDDDVTLLLIAVPAVVTSAVKEARP